MLPHSRRGKEVLHLDIVQDGPEQVGQAGEQDQLGHSGCIPLFYGFWGLPARMAGMDLRVPPLRPRHAGGKPVQEQRCDLHGAQHHPENLRSCTSTITKLLVLHSWHVSPDAIALVCARHGSENSVDYFQEQ